jgi:hypothetical protein
MIYLRNAPKTLVGSFCSRRQSGPASKPQANKALSSQRTQMRAPQMSKVQTPRFSAGLAGAPESVIASLRPAIYLWATSFGTDVRVLLPPNPRDVGKLNLAG